MSVDNRVAAHAAAFNAAVRSGDWTSFGEQFSPDATMTFVGVPVGPFAGRSAIVEAHRRQPPSDTLTVTSVRSEGGADMATVRWGSGGTGAMRLRWDADLVRELEISFD